MSTTFLSEEQLFTAARVLTGEERARFLAENCADPEQIERLVRLLTIYDADRVFLVETAAFRANSPFLEEKAGSVIDSYKLLEQIGEGAFGVVFMAEQQAPVRRKVAVKILKAGIDHPDIIARFEAERQALALMDHPNVASVIGGGTTPSGRPYFVMELVRGIPITEYCDSEQLSTRERLPLFINVCHAVQHAHLKGLIHRDLKPSNVLVTMLDGEPLVKVIDFGVAKAVGQQLTDRTLFTGFAQFVGTPLYMSPEQASFSAVDVDMRSDVYSLGVLLYELITGTTPFEKATLLKVDFDEMRRMIREDEPPRPSLRLSTLAGKELSTFADRRRVDPRKVREQVRSELDWIVMKALDKDRSRRYESCSDFAADVHRFLNDEPVEACPPSTTYRLKKLARRNKGLLTAAALVTVALIAGSAVAVWQAIEANAAHSKAMQLYTALQSFRESERQTAEHNRRLVFAGDMVAASDAWLDNDVARMKNFLVRHVPKTDQVDLRGFEWNFLWNQGPQNPKQLLVARGALYYVTLSPDHRWLAAAGLDGTIRILDAQSHQIVREIQAEQGEVNGLAFSSDSRMLASAGDDGSIVVWNASSGEPGPRFPAYKERVYQVAFAAKDSLLVTCGDHPNLRVWNAKDGTLVKELEAHESQIESLAVSGKYLAAASHDGTVSLWTLPDGQLIRRFRQDSKTSVNSVAFSPDGSIFAYGQTSGMVTQLYTEEASQFAYQSFPEMITNVSFSSVRRQGSEWMAVGDRSGVIRVLPVDREHGASGIIAAHESSRRGPQWSAHHGTVYSTAFSGDGESLFSVGKDGKLLCWDLTPPEFNHVLPSAVDDFAILDDDRFVMELDGRLAVISASDGQVASRLPGPPREWRMFKYAEQAQRIYALDKKGFIFSQSFMGDEPALIWSPGPNETVGNFSVSPDGTALAISVRTPPNDVHVEIWNGEPVSRMPCNVIHAIEHSPDGRYVAFNFDRDIVVLDARTGELFQRIPAHSTTVNSLDFSPDGNLLASASDDRTIKVWHWRTVSKELQAEWTEVAHANFVRSVAFSPDGQSIVSVGDDGWMKLWRWELERQSLEVPLAYWPVDKAAFVHNGRQIIATEEDGIRIYGCEPVQPAAPRPEAATQTPDKSP